MLWQYCASHANKAHLNLNLRERERERINIAVKHLYSSNRKSERERETETELLVWVRWSQYLPHSSDIMAVEIKEQTVCSCVGVKRVKEQRKH